MSFALLVLRALAGGTLVVCFALVSEVLKPKAFAGLFSSAPSVACASLALTIVFETAAKARQESVGMVLGGVAMVAACVVAVVAVPRAKALATSALACVTWGIVAVGLYWTVLSGGR